MTKKVRRVIGIQGMTKTERDSKGKVRIPMNEAEKKVSSHRRKYGVYSVISNAAGTNRKDVIKMKTSNPKEFIRKTRIVKVWDLLFP